MKLAFSSLKSVSVLAALGLIFNSDARATSGTWLNTGTNAAWSSAGNWTGGVVPGDVGGSTTNTDVALFNTAVDTGTGTVGAKNTTPITIDTGRNIGGITFDTGAGNYFIGATAGTPLLLTSGGAITMQNLTTQIETIQAPLIIEGASGTYTFQNNDVALGSGLQFLGAVSGTGAGSTVLTLTGTQPTLPLPVAGGLATTNLISGVISNGAASSVSIDKEGTATWELTGSNTFTGTTTVNGGTLVIGTMTTANAGGGGFAVPSVSAASGSFASTAGITIGASGTLALDMTNNATLGGPISDNGSLVGLEMFWTNVNTVSGSITGTGTFTQDGIGTTLLAGSNSYTGTTLAAAGVIRATDGTGLSSSSLLNLNGGTFETNGSFTRSVGTTGGAPGANVELTGGTSGFSANGGSLIVTLGGVGTPSTLVWGTPTFNPGTFVLNDSTAANTINLENNIDLNGTGHTIYVGANTATDDGAIMSTGVNGALGKVGAGTLVLNGANTYAGGTFVGQGLVTVNSGSSIGTGGATVQAGGELRFNSTSNLAAGQKVLVKQGGVLGFTDNGFNQATLASTLDSKSAGILAIDSTSYGNALDLSALGNGSMFLGSSTTGVYGASTLGIAPGGTDTVSAGLFQQFGGTYQLGGGGGTLVLTGSNVLVDQVASYIATNPDNALGTSNTRNSLTVGTSGSIGAGTLDLANNQSFTGLTKISNGSTLNLDFSGAFATPASNSDILGEGNEVDLGQSNLTITGGSALSAVSSGYSQTLADIGLRSGHDAITVAQGSDPLAANLGVLGNGTAGTGVVGDIGSALQIVNNTGATITTSSAPGADGTTLGGQVVYTSNGTTTWASATANSNGTFTIGAYTGDTANVLANTTVGDPTKDYIVNGNVTFAASETVNLLRVTGNTLTVKNSATGQVMTIGGGGILFTDTGTGSITLNGFGGAFTSGGPANYGGDVSLNLENYGNGEVIFTNAGFIDPTATTTANPQNPTGAEHLVLVLDGPGVFGFANSGTPLVTGGLVLNGGTLDVGGGTPNNFSTGPLVINSGTLVQNSTNGSSDHFDNALILNGNFTLGAVALDLSSNNLDLSRIAGNGSVILNNNITITMNAGSTGEWGFGGGGPAGTLAVNTGQITDEGLGYGLTINIVSGSQFIFNNGIAAVNPFTGPLNLENSGTNPALVSFANNILTRSSVLNVGPGINVILPVSGAFGIAGLNDVGAGANTATITTGVPATTTGNNTLTFWGSDTYSFGGSLNAASSSTHVGLLAIAMDGTGTQILTGSNTFTNGITANAGKIEIDASKGGSVAVNNLALGGGTFYYKGATSGSVLSLGSLTANAGGSTMIVDSNGAAAGATTVHLTTLGAAAGSLLDFDEQGSTATITTTTNFTTNSRLVYTDINGNVTWATGTTNVGLNNFTIGAYTADTTALVASAGNAGVNYMLAGSQTLTASESIADLRITDTGTGSDVLDLAGKNLVFNSDGLLDNSTAAYSINDSVGGGVITAGTGSSNRELDIQNYSTGGLTINAIIGNNGTIPIALSIGGPGLTTLTGSNTFSGITYLNGGTVNFNSMANFGTGTAANGLTFGGGTLQYASGNTTDLSSSGKNVIFNAAGGGIDTNGNNITYAATSFGTGIGGMNVSDSTGTGVLNFDSTSGYTGNTTVQNGGHLNLAGSLVAGNSTIVGSGGLLTGGTNQQTSVAQTTSSNAGRLVLTSGGVIAPGDTAGGLNITGRGVDTNDRGDQATSATKPTGNVLNATGLVWNAGGTLKFQLDNTILPETFGPGFGQGPGTALDPSASTTLNLGQGGLQKVAGAGKFTLDFQNTGAWDMNFATNGDNAQNVYDLINFGVTNQLGVITPNTNFSIDDFTIVNLSGVGTLSFYFNANADGGIGQEELLLTVIPEPSTWAMLVGGLVTLVFWTRRRRTAFAKSK